MKKIHSIDGTVVSLEHLAKIRKHMEEAAADEYNISYNKTQLNNVEYVQSTEHYKFTLEFFA